jgi:MYXO-CTERM domain-containing protein
MTPASGASGSTGTMQNANSIAGSTAPATAGTAAAPMTAPPASSDSGCSVHRSGNTSSQAGWLLALAALALFRRRRTARR